MENKITTYGYVFSHTHVTKNDICSAVLVLCCCSQSECSPVLFKYLDRFLTKWHCIVYRWKAIVNAYLMRLFPRSSAIKSRSYIQNTTFCELISHISLSFSYQMVCYYIPLESPFRCLSSGTGPIFPRLEYRCGPGVAEHDSWGAYFYPLRIRWVMIYLSGIVTLQRLPYIIPYLTGSIPAMSLLAVKQI